MNRILLLLIVLLSACQGASDPESQTSAPVDLQAALPGTWEAVSLRVKVNTAGGEDSSYVFEVGEEEWVRRLGVRPVKTYYEPDNRYRQEFYAVNDSMVNQARGVWNVFGDTLMMIAPDATYQYTVKVSEGRSEYRALVDWDGDGDEDDEYLGVQRLIGIGTD